MNLKWGGFCHRCLVTVSSYSMSWFNEQLICVDCSDAEANHPKYKKARLEELNALKAGNANNNIGSLT